MRRRGVRLLAVGLALLGLGVDQIVKLASVTYLTPGEPVNVIGSLLRLNLIRNPGAAFGMGANSTIFFTIFAIVAALACVFVALPRITKVWHGITLGLLLGGVLGNLVDRIFQPPAAFHGHVIDMFQLPNFAIFNVADMCITVAAGIMIIGSFFGEEEKQPAKAES